MAGLGFEPDDFALFEIDDPEERAEALEETILPKLRRLGADLQGGLSRMAGTPLFVHPGKTARKKGAVPEESFLAFCDSEKSYRSVPYLAVVVTRAHVHARVAVRPEADLRDAMVKALQREAGNLARKGKPFRKLRQYMGWDFEELPEIAPAHSAAFWEELAEGLAAGAKGPGLDVGIAWSSEDARGLAVGDVLGAFRDLSPLYKLLLHAE